MKKILSFLVVSLLCATSVNAQTDQSGESPFQGVDGIAKKEHIAEKKYIPYTYVREADVLWSKTIWRIIDLREKINHPLYYPTRLIDGRMSLGMVIYDAIANGDLRVYSSNTDNEFTLLLDKSEVDRTLGAGTDTTEMEDPETGELRTIVMSNEFSSDVIKKYLLKEVWYFDKKHTRMDVRIIGICPIVEMMNAEGNRLDQKLTFWVYFPELRPFLVSHEVYNTKNDAQRESFDDLFAQRQFGSYIYKESNVYNNRTISDYTQGMESTMEAERIRQELFIKEHDMWEF